jgi:hypothetical protein
MTDDRTTPVRVEPATPAWLEALAAGDDEFSAAFGIPVEPGWLEFPEALSYALESDGDDPHPEWGFHLFFATADGALVGNGGWKGPPVDGAAELGYAVAPRGATAASRPRSCRSSFAARGRPV